jgi:hypothetical protein
LLTELSLNPVKRGFHLEAEKGSGLATGTKVNLLLAVLAARGWLLFLFGRPANIGKIHPRPHIPNTPSSQPTIRTAAALQPSCASILARIGIFALHLVHHHHHLLLLLMWFLSFSASRHSFHPIF